MSPRCILTVHAHPDDESLDFAGLICRANRAGFRTAVVIMTDGESGLDRYPDRPVGGVYAAGEMVGGLFYGNYPGGAGLMSGATFGRIAGMEAGRRAIDHKG